MEISSFDEKDDSKNVYMINAQLLLHLPLNGIIIDSLGNNVLLCSGAFNIK